jgi:lipopolysaccharide export system protein LptA
VRAEGIIKSDIPIWDIHIQPEVTNGRHVLLLTNNSGCQITESDGNSITAKKITWHSNQQLVFAKPDSMARLEVTYRVEE